MGSPCPKTEAPSRLSWLTDPRFLAAVLLLLANDAVFKQVWPGWVTGKLSDVAGLFAWTFFWSALLPNRFTAWVAVATGTGFVYWKSSAAETLITWWNVTAAVPIARVVDFTDLVALAVLPLAVIAVRRARPIGTSRVLRVSAAICSVFAFAATSVIYPVTVWPDNLEFEVPSPRADVLAELVRRGQLTGYADSILAAPVARPLDFRLRDTPCELEGKIILTQQGPRTVISVREVKGMEICMGYEPSRPGIRTEIRDFLIWPLENWLLATRDSGFRKLAPELRPVLGCYSIELGRWHPKPGSDHRFMVWLPDDLELIDSLGWRHFEGYRGRRLALPDRRDRSVWWEPIEPDSFRIAGVSNRGRLGVEIRLARGVDQSVGAMAQSFGDSSQPQFEAPASVRRVPCKPARG
jgi:hypothetical protein